MRTTQIQEAELSEFYSAPLCTYTVIFVSSGPLSGEHLVNSKALCTPDVPGLLLDAATCPAERMMMFRLFSESE